MLHVFFEFLNKNMREKRFSAQNQGQKQWGDKKYTMGCLIRARDSKIPG